MGRSATRGCSRCRAPPSRAPSTSCRSGIERASGSSTPSVSGVCGAGGAIPITSEIGSRPPSLAPLPALRRRGRAYWLLAGHEDEPAFVEGPPPSGTLIAPGTCPSGTPRTDHVEAVWRHRSRGARRAARVLRQAPRFSADVFGRRRPRCGDRRRHGTNSWTSPNCGASFVGHSVPMVDDVARSCSDRERAQGRVDCTSSPARLAVQDWARTSAFHAAIARSAARQRRGDRLSAGDPSATNGTVPGGIGVCVLNRWAAWPARHGCRRVTGSAGADWTDARYPARAAAICGRAATHPGRSCGHGALRRRMSSIEAVYDDGNACVCVTDQVRGAAEILHELRSSGTGLQANNSYGGAAATTDTGRRNASSARSAATIATPSALCRANARPCPGRPYRSRRCNAVGDRLPARSPTRTLKSTVSGRDGAVPRIVERATSPSGSSRPTT